MLFRPEEQHMTGTENQSLSVKRAIGAQGGGKQQAGSEVSRVLVSLS